VKAVGAGGSAHQQVIQDACRTELRERCQAAWEILRNVAMTSACRDRRKLEKN
jgi:hypothetical protein